MEKQAVKQTAKKNPDPSRGVRKQAADASEIERQERTPETIAARLEAERKAERGRGDLGDEELERASEPTQAATDQGTVTGNRTGYPSR
jgi:hypothetical protein